MNQLETQLFLSAQNVLVTEAMLRMGKATENDFNLACERYMATKERLVKSYAKKRPKTEREARPSMDEVTEFMTELGREDPDEDSAWFMDKMLAQGWLNGGQQIKSWQALLRNWDRSGYINPKRGDDKIQDKGGNNQRRQMQI